MSEYPEHDKLMAVKDESQVIGSFLEWLAEKGYKVSAWTEFTETQYLWVWPDYENGTREDQLSHGLWYWSPDRSTSTGRKVLALDEDGNRIKREHVTHEGWDPHRGGIQALLSRYFDIDLAKIDREKDQMLDSLRAAQNTE